MRKRHTKAVRSARGSLSGEIKNIRVIHTNRIEKATTQTEPFFGDEITHPYDTTRGDMILYYSLLAGFNAYHSRCLRVKVDCMVNLGVNVTLGDQDAVLDRLNVVNAYGQSFQEVITRVALDYESTGNGYLEVVRGLGGRVEELYHCPSTLVTLRPRISDSAFYYRNESVPVPFQAFRSENKNETNTLLHFANYSHSNLYYGLPDWRGCIQDIELSYYASLYNQNFFVNSGIPDMAIVVEGGNFTPEAEETITSFFQSNFKGYANAHRTLIVPVSDANAKIRFEKLATDTKNRDASFKDLQATCRDNIISAHGVPPRLLGIMAAGQLGGGGETNGQLKIFQEVTIRPRQVLFETKLGPVLKSMMGTEVQIQFEQIDVAIQEAASDFYPSMVQAGILSIDEAREEMGYAAEMDGNDGKESDKTGENDKDQDKAALKLVKSLQEFRKAL